VPEKKNRRLEGHRLLYRENQKEQRRCVERKKREGDQIQVLREKEELVSTVRGGAEERGVMARSAWESVERGVGMALCQKRSEGVKGRKRPREEPGERRQKKKENQDCTE
jgi:hypothetical protein